MRQTTAAYLAVVFTVAFYLLFVVVAFTIDTHPLVSVACIAAIVPTAFLARKYYRLAYPYTDKRQHDA